MNQAHDLNERYVNTYAAPVQQTAVHQDVNICPKDLLKGLNWKKNKPDWVQPIQYLFRAFSGSKQ